jgi:hypothetical protein
VLERSSGSTGRAVPEEQVARVAAADEERVDPQSELVEQPMLDQRPREPAEPVLHDVLAGLLLETADLAA